MAMTAKQLKAALDDLTETAEGYGRVKQRMEDRQAKYGYTEDGSPAEVDLNNLDKKDKESADTVKKEMDVQKQKIIQDMCL